MLPDVEEAVVFIVHAIKQFCYGFERLIEVSEVSQPGSPLKAFYMNALYHNLTVFYLLEAKPDKPMGGAFFPALERLGLAHLLHPIQEILQTRVGSATFGELTRLFRNKVLVHTRYANNDLDRIYGLANMHNEQVMNQFMDLFTLACHKTRLLMFDVVQQAGLKLEDFGLHESARHIVITQS